MKAEKDLLTTEPQRPGTHEKIILNKFYVTVVTTLIGQEKTRAGQ